VLIARDSKPFNEESADLLVMAEEQIDSAVIQARTIWRLAERNRELEAIYQIDRLRDDTTDEQSLFLSIVSLMMKQFRASYCQLILLDTETGTPQTNAITDLANLGTGVQDRFIALTRDIQTTTLIESPIEVSLRLIASPLIVSGTRLGVIVLGRKQAFTISDTRLMIAMCSQIDSAISKSRTNLLLAQRSKELEAIYTIDQIRDRENDFDVMLQMVLDQLCHSVSSETGYLMLYNAQKEDVLEIRATTSNEVIKQPEYFDIIQRVSREALDSERVIVHNRMSGTIHSIVSVPLILNEKIIGVFGAVNSHNPGGFTADDGKMLTAITSQVDTAVFERLERRRLRQVLGRSVDPKVLEALLKRADDSLLTGERVILSVLFADLRGSTEWAERTDPEELVSLLNIFLGKMTEIIFKYGGTLDKFVGDEVIALFGSPVSMEDHALKASLAALEMQEVHQRIRAELAEEGRELPLMGIGVSSGEVITGEFGPPIRTDFTAMGRVMNLGARLCSAATGNQIVISENTFIDLGAQADVRELEQVPLKGIQRSVRTFELLSLKS
jgi:class 3 adenylate cyclase